MGQQKQRRKGIAKIFLSSKILPWVICDFLIAYVLFHTFAEFGRGTDLPTVQNENQIASLTLSLLFCIVGIGFGFFERENRSRKLEIVKLGTAAWLLAISLGIAVLHFALFMKVGRYALVFGSIASILGVLAFHFFMANLLLRYPHEFIFLGGQSPTAKEITKFINLGQNAHLAFNESVNDAINQSSKSEIEIEHILMQNAPLDIVLTSNSEADKFSTRIATIALQKGLRVIDEGSFYAEIFRRYPIENLSAHWIVRAGFDIQKPLTNSIKRCTDFLGAALLSILFAPLMLLIAIAIKLTSRGPVFYVQTRQGRYSRPFQMIKFRTMIANHKGRSATEVGDSRITGIGKLIRPLHLDELPQFWNILKGQMSFVGPRPEAIEIVNKTKVELPIFEIRHMVRPGLTGWAQINQGKTQDGIDEVRTKLSYDLYYAKNYGLVLDLLITLRTLFVLTKSAW